MIGLSSYNHEIYGEVVYKMAVAQVARKCYILADGIATQAYDHKDTTKAYNRKDIPR